METYRAVIHEPNKAAPEPDRYGTLTIPGEQSTYGPNPVPLRVWAKEALTKCSPGAFCDIYRIEQVLVEVIQQCSVKS